jgi:hypothetical protein
MNNMGGFAGMISKSKSKAVVPIVQSGGGADSIQTVP